MDCEEDAKKVVKKRLKKRDSAVKRIGLGTPPDCFTVKIGLMMTNLCGKLKKYQ